MARSFNSLTATVLILLSTAAAGAADDAGGRKSYLHTLQLGDRVRVTVYQEEDLATVARIDAKGRVSLPLVGEVEIGGQTPSEAQAVIAKAYRDGRFLRDPRVSLAVEEYAPREVTIQGAVRSPSRYTLPVESTYTLVELVAKAGGLLDVAKGSAVSVTRVLPDGTKKVFTIDVEAFIKGRKGGKGEDADFLLQPGDIVFVPESLI